MSARIEMSVAGVRLLAEWNGSIGLETLSGAYDGFVRRVGDDAPAPDMQVTLVREDPLEPDPEMLVFDTGDSWRLHRHGNGLLLTFHPPGQAAPFWQARIDSAFQHATLACGPDLFVQRQGARVLVNPVAYPLDQILFMYLLARRNGAIFHAAAAVRRGRACLFPGVSGAGKSTVSRLLAEAGWDVLSDDRCAVVFEDKRAVAYGTPWPGDAGYAENRGAPLDGVFFLEQADTCSVGSPGLRGALHRFLPVTGIPWYDDTRLPGMLAFLERLASMVPCRDLLFTPDANFVEVVENTLDRA
ncbi:MAG: hypothetical protein ACLFOY_11810 [Desulfatibacillaceae bacterium]